MSVTSVDFEPLPYWVHPETGLIDFEQLQASANLFKQNMIICGGSACPREWDHANSARSPTRAARC